MAISGTFKRIVIDEIAPPGGYWPMRWAWLTGIFLPVTTIRRCDRGRFWPALATGAVTLLTGLVGGLLLAAWANTPLEFGGLSGTLAQLSLWWKELLNPSGPSGPRGLPLWSALIGLAAVLIGASGQALLGLISYLPLVARPGKRNTSMLRLLGRTLVLLPHVLATLLVIIALTIGLWRASQRANQEFNRLHPPPVYPFSALPTTSPNQPPTLAQVQAGQQWNHDMVEYQRQQWEYEARQSWWLRHKELVVSVVWLGWPTWMLFVILRGLGHAPWAPRCAWPALCEGCGYALTGLRMEAVCPECGRPLGQSIGPSWRPGLPWDEPSSRWWRHLPATWWLAVRHPTVLGQRMRTGTPSRRVLPVLLLLALAGGMTGVLGVVGQIGVARFFHLRDPWGTGFDEIGLLAGMMAVVDLWALPAALMFFAMSRGWRAPQEKKDHLWPAAAQAVVALGGWAWAWLVVIWLVVWFLFVANEVDLGYTLNTLVPHAGDLFPAVLVIGVFSAAIGVGIHLLRRIMQAARYANR